MEVDGKSSPGRKIRPLARQTGTNPCQNAATKRIKTKLAGIYPHSDILGLTFTGVVYRPARNAGGFAFPAAGFSLWAARVRARLGPLLIEYSFPQPAIL